MSNSNAGKIRPNERAARGRDRLLLVAMDLFAERGFDGVTVRDISAAAEVSVGLINHHFASKEGLRQAVDDYFIQRIGAALDRAIDASRNLDPDGMAEYERQWIVRYADEWPQFVAYLRRAIMEGSDWGQTLLKRYFESIRAMVDRFDAEGRIAPEVDRLWLPFLQLFMVLGPIMLDPYIKSVLGKSVYDPDMWARFQRASTALFWRGAGRGRPEVEEK